MAKTRQQWPSTRYGPNGQSRVFQAESDVPKGWVDHPSKVSGMADLEAEQADGREELANARGAEAAARERIRLAQIEERRRTGSNTAADNLIFRNPAVVEKAEKQQAGARTEAQAATPARTHAAAPAAQRDVIDLGTVKEIRAKLDSGELTIDQIEKAELTRESPRSTILELVERTRAEAAEKAKATAPEEGTGDAELLTREEAIAELRKHGVALSDDATDEEIEAALSKLENGG